MIERCGRDVHYIPQPHDINFLYDRYFEPNRNVQILNYRPTQDNLVSGNEDYVEKAKKNLIKSENIRDCIDSCEMRSWSNEKTTCNVDSFDYIDPETNKTTKYTWDFCDSTTNINCPKSKCNFKDGKCKNKM